MSIFLDTFMNLDLMEQTITRDLQVVKKEHKSGIRTRVDGIFDSSNQYVTRVLSTLSNVVDIRMIDQLGKGKVREFKNRIRDYVALNTSYFSEKILAQRDQLLAKIDKYNFEDEKKVEFPKVYLVYVHKYKTEDVENEPPKKVVKGSFLNSLASFLF